VLLDVWQGADHGVMRAQILKLLHALAQLWAVQAEAVKGARHSQVGIGHAVADEIFAAIFLKKFTHLLAELGQGLLLELAHHTLLHELVFLIVCIEKCVHEVFAALVDHVCLCALLRTGSVQFAHLGQGPADGSRLGNDVVPDLHLGQAA